MKNFVFQILLPNMSLKYVTLGSIDNVNISPDNGLVPNRGQVIIWDNDDQAYWHICVSLSSIKTTDKILA